jgi:hypothetical protein
MRFSWPPVGLWTEPVTCFVPSALLFVFVLLKRLYHGREQCTNCT